MNLSRTKYENESFTGSCPTCHQEFLKERLDAAIEGLNSIKKISDDLFYSDGRDLPGISRLANEALAAASKRHINESID